MSALIEVSNVGKSFKASSGQEFVALKDVSLEVREAEFLALLGPSGSGKSTLLQIMAGLASADRGSVRFEGELVKAPPQRMVYLFQQYAKSLLAWRTVEDNVALPLEERRDVSRQQRRERSHHYLERVGLGSFAKHFPWQLSGGMQQRVAIARALAAEPRVLLLDEPFSAVDALTRLELQALVIELWQQQKLTIVMVTHDVDEAVFMADRIALLSRRPAVLDRLMVPGLARPRDAISTREEPEFLRARHELLNRLLNKNEEEAVYA
jgi:NitT/TauT family transport system ATP-binding protein